MSKYLIATMCGGIMESPDIYYTNYQIITANTSEEACEIYNKKNNCNYYYANTIMQVDDDVDENDVESVLNDIREHFKKFEINPNII